MDAEQASSEGDDAFLQLEASASSLAALQRATRLIALAMKGHLAQQTPSLQVQQIPFKEKDSVGGLEV